MEEHTEGGVKRKGEAAGFSRRDTRQRETLGTLLGQTPEKQKPFTFTFTYYSEEKDPQNKETQTGQSNKNNRFPIGSRILEVHEVYHAKQSPGDDSPPGRSFVSE